MLSDARVKMTRITRDDRMIMVTYKTSLDAQKAKPWDKWDKNKQHLSRVKCSVLVNFSKVRRLIRRMLVHLEVSGKRNAMNRKVLVNISILIAPCLG